MEPLTIVFRLVCFIDLIVNYDIFNFQSGLHIEVHVFDNRSEVVFVTMFLPASPQDIQFPVKSNKASRCKRPTHLEV
jgi:hypothetical protein